MTVAPVPSEEMPSLSGERNRFARELFTGLPGRYDALAEILSFGQNSRWRRAMVDRIEPSRPARVLDVATGTAGVALQVARRLRADVVGVDLTEAMLTRGRERLRACDAEHRVQLVGGRAEQLPFGDEVFDGLTFTYLLRYVDDPTATLRELVRVVKPGGPVANLEFHVPSAPFWRFWWWVYTRGLLPIAAGVGGRAWFAVGRFLGPSISAFYRRHPLPSILDAWREVGLHDVGVAVMSLGGGVVTWGRKRG